MTDVEPITDWTEIEDDVGELASQIAYEEIMDGGAPDVLKAQFRDAIVKLIDERIAVAVGKGKR